MSGKKYLLDTNIIIGLFGGDKEIIEKIKSAKEAFIPSIVLGELFYGAEQSSKKESNKSQIEAFSKVSIILDCNGETAQYYGKIKSELKRKGKPIPENDIWIAAIAFQHKLTLITRDGHFNYIENLHAEEW